MTDDKLEKMFESLVSQSEARLDVGRMPGKATTAGQKDQSSTWYLPGSFIEARLGHRRPRFVFPIAIAAVVVVAAFGVTRREEPGSVVDSATPVVVIDETEPAATAAEASSKPIAIRMAGKTEVVDVNQLKQWVGAAANPSNTNWTLDEPAVVAGLIDLFDLSSDSITAKVVSGELVAVPGGPTCCPAGTMNLIADHLNNSANSADFDEPLDLMALIPTEETAANELSAMGIVEPVSTYKTNFPCCANRVANIHRFAELMNGTVVEPNSAISLNDHVGQPTEANGFKSDGVIVDGELVTQVGGGVSQYATALFNAAFLAGLEFDDYQSHPRFVSRYPEGREADLLWPDIDLVVRNQTDHAVLIWSEYTSTSLTVTLYSTEHIETTAGLPRSQPTSENCRMVSTPRTRRYSDGTVETDSVLALYANKVGVVCDDSELHTED